MFDHLEERDLVFVDEGRVPREHLVEDAAEGPVVDHTVVARVLELFGREVGLRPADAVGLDDSDCSTAATLRETEVGQLRVACCVQQDVLGLQVPVDDVQTAMQVLETEQNLCGDEPDFFQVEDFPHLHISAQVAAGQVLQTEVEVGVVLEGAEELDDEGTPAAREDLSFGQDLAESGVSDLHLRLRYRFDGVVLEVLRVLPQVDLSETADPDDLSDENLRRRE